MADRIELRGLECFGYHGVFEEEKRTGQTFLVDLICWLDCAEAARTDDLNLTINYADLAHMAHTIVSGPRVTLLKPSPRTSPTPPWRSIPNSMPLKLPCINPRLRFP